MKIYIAIYIRMSLIDSDFNFESENKPISEDI